MPNDRQRDQSISRWLEAEAPTQLPDRVLRATFERTREIRQQGGWRLRLRGAHVHRFASALGGAAVIVIAAALALGLYANQPDVGGPVAPAPVPTESTTPAPSEGQPAAFAGDWEGTDSPPDSSHLTMAIVAQTDGTYDLTIRDDSASVCGGTPSTMTGVAEASEPDTIVIAQPDYKCDDGSPAQAHSGPPLEDQLRNLGLTYDSQRDEMEDSFGLVWHRPTAEPTATEPGGSQAAAFAGNWEATDSPPDSSHLTMEIIAQPDGTYEVTILDDFASVCDGASSTMTGVAETQKPGTFVIAQPDYVCDDGSEAQAVSGPIPLEELLRNYTFVYDASRDVLVEGVVWSRVRVAPSGEEASPSAPAPSDGQAFTGTWEATDPPPDSSHLTMEVIAMPNGSYEVTIRDDFASVCDGAPSTMTGVAESREPNAIVIAQPEYKCDDGSPAQALSGPPLEDQLRNLGFIYDSQRDTFQDSLGLVWIRVKVVP